MSNELILIVEDDEENAQSVSEWLELVGYQTLWAATAQSALEQLEHVQPTLILSDINMPQMDGYQFYKAVRARPEWTAIPFLFLTGRAERRDMLAAKGLGADDYLIKPWSPDELLLAVHAKIKRMKEVALVQLRQAYKDSLFILAAAIEARDAYTRGHLGRVAAYATIVGRELGLNEQQLADLELGAILHDIGKIAVSENILAKSDGLNEQEFAEMRKHPAIGAAMIKDISYLAAAIPTIRHHHERYDGNGYPDGLVGEAIPFMARVLAVADALDAMTTHRIYRPARSLAETLEIIRRESGKQFDPQVVAALFQAIDNGLLTAISALNGAPPMDTNQG